MAFPTTASLAAYLKLETAVEYPLVDVLISASLAQIALYINRPIVATSASYYIHNDSAYLYGASKQLTIPVYPISPTAITIADIDGEVVSGSTYHVHGALGYVEALPGYSFDNGPYTVNVVEGLATLSDYSTNYEPVINQAIYDLVFMYFSQRNPDVKSDTQGDIQQTYYGMSMPPRVAVILNQLKMPGIAR
jgi:hypothetical protein